MAGPTLCVTCASLPIKDREVATRIRRCPECKAEVGVTSYGKPFRARAAKRGGLLTPSIFVSVCAGGCHVDSFCSVPGLLYALAHRTRSTAREADGRGQADRFRKPADGRAYPGS